MDSNMTNQKECKMSLRMNEEEKTLIESAANLNAQTFSSFAMGLLIEKSREVIKMHQETILSIEEAQELMEIIDCDDDPSEVLVSAKNRCNMFKMGWTW